MMDRFIGIERLVLCLAAGLSHVKSADTNGFDTRTIGSESAPVGEYP